MIDLKRVSEMVGGRLKGDPDLKIIAVNSLDKAGPREITFAAKDSVRLQEIRAAALIVRSESKIDYPNLVYVEEPYLAFSILLEYFFPRRRFSEGIAGNAHISPSATLGQDVSVGPFSYIGDDSGIGDGTEIHAGVKIYHNVKIGKNCLIYANVVIREQVEIGDHVILHPGVVIGGDGFGYTRTADRGPVKVPQKGKVIIGNHCEIGANSCIDRATVGETVLGDHVKLDNLVQIGHNCKVGNGASLSGLCGISGSVEIGENVVMGGQVGVADHAKIAPGVMVAGKTGITGSIKEKCIVSGYPHQEFRQWRRNITVLKNIDQYIDRLKNLEMKIKEMEDKHET